MASNTKKWKGFAAEFIRGMRTQFIGRGAEPKDIFVQDLYNYQPPATQGASLMKMYKSKNSMFNLDTNDRQILESIYAVFNEHITTKRELLTQSRILYETTDVVNILIDVVSDDGFNNFYNEKEEFKIEYRLSEEERSLLGQDFEDNIQNIIDEFISKFNIKQKVADILPDLIVNGEYAFGVTFEDKKGIKEVIDDIDVIDLLPFYEGDNISFIIKQDSNINNGKFAGNINQPKFYNPDNFIFFRLKGANKKKINLSAFYNNEFRKEFYEKHHIRLPKYVRIPTPMYNTAIRYLNRLKVMENVSTVTDMADILRPEIVSVTIPSQSNEVDANNIVRNYERRLNDKGDLSDAENLDVQTLATNAYRKIVLPQWADNKGTIASTGVGNTDSGKTTAAWESIGRIRNLIALQIGLPPYYLNITETPAEKAQTIKLYSRYTNKLTSIQKALSEGVKDFIMLHLTKMGLNISRDNIEVTFKTLTNGDNLDDLDLMAGTIESVNNYYKGLKEITEDEQFEIDPEQFKMFYDKVTSRYLNTKDIIRIKTQEQPSQGQGNEFEGEDSGFESDFGEGEDDFEVTGEGPTREGSQDEVPFTKGTGEESAYDNFARQDDGISLEGPQEITTEV